MAQNLTVDPTTRDYVLDSLGRPVPTDRIQEKAFIALSIPRGRYVYETPQQGSLLWTLQNELREPSLDARFNAYATDAIKRQLVATGQATDVLSRNVGFSRTSTTNEIDVEAAEVQVSNQLDFLPVG